MADSRGRDGTRRRTSPASKSQPAPRPPSLVDQLTQDPGIHVRFRQEQGDIVLIDNYAIAHSHAAFEDHDDPDLRRHLLRLWLVLHEGRDLAPDVDNRAGSTTTADIVEDGLAPA